MPYKGITGLSTAEILAIIFLSLFCIKASNSDEKGFVDAVERAIERFKLRDYEGCIEAHRLVEEAFKGIGNKEKGIFKDRFLSSLFVNGYSLWMRRNLEEAIRSFERYEKEGGLISDYARYFIACIRFQQKKYSLIPPLLSEFERKFPDSPLIPDSKFLKAKSLYLCGEYESVIPLLEEISRLVMEPDLHIESQILLIKSLLRKGDKAKAIPLLERLWAEHPAHESSREVAHLMEDLINDGYVGPSVERRFDRALKFLVSGMVDECKRELLAIKRGFPPEKLPVSLDYYIALCSFRKKDYKKAEEEFLDYYRKGKSPRFSARALFYGGLSRARQGRFDDALELYRLCIRRFPDTPASRDSSFKLAYTAFWDERYELSLDEFKYYYERYRRYGKGDEALWYMGLSSYKTKKFERASNYFRKLKEEYPFSSLYPGALYWAGKSRLKSGDKRGANKYFEMLAERFPLSFYTLLAINYIDGGFKIAKNFGQNTRIDIEEICNEAVLRRPCYLSSIGLDDMIEWELKRLEEGPLERETALKIALFYHSQGNYNQGIKSGYRLFPDVLSPMMPDKKHFITAFYPTGYKDRVEKEAIKYGIDEALLYAIIREESAFLVDAVSRNDARGLMQIIPSTGLSLATKMGMKGFVLEDLFNPDMNINLGSFYIKELTSEFHGLLPLIVASYNAGEVMVREWIEKNGDMEMDEFIESIPFTETRRYVRRVLESYSIYRALYGEWSPGVGIDPRITVHELLEKAQKNK